MKPRLLEPLKQMLAKEFTQLFRDPKMRRMLWIMPVIEMLVFGYVVTLDVEHVPIAIYDLDNSAQSRDLVARFLGSKYFNVVKYVNKEEQVANLIDRSEADAVLRINHGFGGLLDERKTAPVQLILDGTNSNTTAVVLNYANQILREYDRQIELRQAADIAGNVPDPGGATLDYRAWFNPNLESRNFFLPGVIALIVMSIAMSLSGMAIVREKEIGTIEQIWVTPITKVEFILGKLIPPASIGLIDVALVTLICVFWFRVPFNGSAIILLLGGLFFIIGILGVGLLISTLSQTQQQAMLGTTFFINPFMMLSGFVFPIANMPPVVRWLTYFDPVRYALIVIRGVFLKGIGMIILWPQFAALLAISFAILSLAIMRLRKTLE